MTVEQMREFVTLAEERNYLVAADMLYSTQATLSRHIMAMEGELGFALFNRSTKKIELTQEGGRFLVYARRAVKLMDDCMAELNWAKRSMSHTLTVGYNALVTFYGFTERLTRFLSANTQEPVKMVEDDTDVLIRDCLNGSCDLAFLQEDPFSPPEGLDRLRIASDTLVAVLPSGHPLASRESLALSELAGEDFAFGIEDKAPASVFIEACRRAGFNPHVVRGGLVGPSLFGWIGSSDCVGLEWKEPAKRHLNSRTAIVDISPTLRSFTSIVFRSERLSPFGRSIIDFFGSTAIGKEYRNEV